MRNCEGVDKPMKKEKKKSKKDEDEKLRKKTANTNRRKSDNGKDLKVQFQELCYLSIKCLTCQNLL